MLAKSFTFILPYFPSTVDEDEYVEGHLTPGKTMATLLSSIPLTTKGPAQVVLFDMHNVQEQNYFTSNVIPRLESAVPLLLEAVESTFSEDANVSYAFPDDRAFKRLGRHVEGEEIIMCSNIKVGGKQRLSAKGNPQGKDVVIINDVVFSGDNFIECIQVLKAAGAKSVSAYATHAVFPHEAWRKFTNPEIMPSRFWITDSLPHAHAITRYKPFKLLSIGWAITNMLHGYDLF